MTNILNISPGDPPVNFETPPQTSIINGFEHGNLICAGDNNQIYGSRRCSIINGKNHIIGDSYNAHIIGDRDSVGGYVWSNIFFVYCSNGIKCTGDIVAYCRSDERLKKDIGPIKNASNKLKLLNPVSFCWNDKQETYEGNDIGLIAQDVRKVMPDIIDERESGFLAIEYIKLIPYLVASIKEKQKVINKLNKKING